MIIYDLKCEKGHKFEGWFHDRKVFEDQKGQKLVSCPICSSADVELLPSSLTVMGRDNKRETRREREFSPLRMLQLFNDYLEKNFHDVGDKFAEVAIRIHHGEEEEHNIKGTTTQDEEETLQEEGIQFIKIPMLKFDS